MKRYSITSNTGLRERDKSAVEIMPVLRKWLNQVRDINRLTIAAVITAEFGSAGDIAWWMQQWEVAGEEPAYTAWLNTLFILRRRRWQELS